MRLTTKHTKHTKAYKAMARIYFVCSVCFVVNVFDQQVQAERPNVLWLSTEDMSPHLGCYGDEHARTPNIDELAAQGVLFKNAFVPAPVCAVCRSSIITGVYATSLGTHHMRSRVKLPAEIRCFTEYLREAGYYCTNNAKEDYNFRTPKSAWDESSGRAHWRNRPSAEQPFFAVFNYTGTHESSVRGDEPKYSRTIAGLAPEELHDPASLTLPPYYPDTPKVRSHWARYYNTISALDEWVGERLAELEKAGLADSTIVVFWSDHGAGLPRAKRWLYDSGLRVPLIIHVPEKYRGVVHSEPGELRDQLASLIDLAPTMLNLAGLAIPAYMQGQPLLGPNLPAERKYIYASRDRMDESYDMVRCVRDKRYKYIRNFLPWRPYAQISAYPENNDVMRELRRLHAAGELNADQSLFMRSRRPVEELYDLELDPDELRNLAAEKSDEPILKRLAGELGPWMHYTRDQGVVPEGMLERTLEPGGTRYGLYRRVGGEQQYADVLAAAQGGAAWFALQPDCDPRWVGVGLAMTHQSQAPAVAYWGAQIYALSRLHGDDSLYRQMKDQERPLHDDPTIRVMAAEMMLQGAGDDQSLRNEAIASLTDLYENGASRWDQIAAACVIDLLPDVEERGPQLLLVNDRVAKQLRDARPSDVGAQMLRRWVERFDVLLGADD
jgi:uncharacterized sulfatase